MSDEHDDDAEGTTIRFDGEALANLGRIRDQLEQRDRTARGGPSGDVLEGFTGPRHNEAQLSLGVELHRTLQEEGHEGYWQGSLVVADLTVHRDFNAGDELTVMVADADGVVVATSTLVCRYPTFHAIKDKGVVIGTERRHKTDRR